MIDQFELVVLTDSTIESAFPKSISKKVKNKIVRWSIPDPQREPIEGVRLIRDQIERRVKELANSPQRVWN